MLNNAIARRYAHAFFSIAQEKNQLDKMEEELALIKGAINTNNDLKGFIEHELVEPQAKKQTVEKLFSGKVSDITLNFLELLIDKHREALIEDIYDEFVNYANEARNILDAEVTSAFELKKDEIKEIESKLASCTGKKIRLVAKADSDLIGGVVVRIGDKIFDSSVLSRLQGLKSKLKQNIS